MLRLHARPSVHLGILCTGEAIRSAKEFPIDLVRGHPANATGSVEVGGVVGTGASISRFSTMDPVFGLIALAGFVLLGILLSIDL